MLNRFHKFKFAAPVLLAIAWILQGSPSWSQTPDPDPNSEPPIRQLFGGAIPTEEGKEYPITGSIEELPENATYQQLETIRDAYIEDGAIFEAPTRNSDLPKPLILVIDTPTKMTRISPEYKNLFTIHRVVIDDGLLESFQRHSKNFCAVLKMCFTERKQTALKFAKILAPAAGFTAALKGILIPKTIAVAAITVHPALFAVWQTTFMMSYTYFKTRYSQGIDRIFTYSKNSMTKKSVRRWIVARSLVLNYAFDISMALLINYAMGHPNSDTQVILNSLVIDSMGNLNSFIRNEVTNRTIAKYPRLAHLIMEGKQDIGILEKMAVTPFTLVMRNLFTLGVIPSVVSAGGSFLLYSGVSLYRLIRGPEGFMKDMERAQGAEEKLDKVSRLGQKAWLGMLKISLMGCVTFFSPENGGLVGPALERLDPRFIGI